MTSSAPDDALGHIEFSPGAEEWIEYGPEGARERVGFHDYSTLYAVPGLYDRVFYGELGMSSADEVVALYARALEAEGLDPAGQRVLDLGAGSGAAGERLARLGIAGVVGLDLEPAARDAVERDRAGTYEDYLILDLGAASDDEMDALAARGFTAVLAVAAVGMGHIPPAVLERALGLLDPGGVFAFPISTDVLEGDDDEARAFRAFFAELFDGTRAVKLAEHHYVHRRSTDGSPHPALAVVGRRV